MGSLSSPLFLVGRVVFTSNLHETMFWRDSRVCSAEYLSVEASFAKSAPVKYHTGNSSRSDMGREWQTVSHRGRNAACVTYWDHRLKAKTGILAVGQNDWWHNKTTQEQIGYYSWMYRLHQNGGVFSDRLRRKEQSVWHNLWCAFVSRQFQLCNCHTGDNNAAEGKGWMRNGHHSLC